jgi:hypothetical protein
MTTPTTAITINSGLSHLNRVNSPSTSGITRPPAAVSAACSQSLTLP